MPPPAAKPAKNPRRDKLLVMPEPPNPYKDIETDGATARNMQDLQSDILPCPLCANSGHWSVPFISAFTLWTSMGDSSGGHAVSMASVTAVGEPFAIASLPLPRAYSSAGNG